jgi:hypothetical protein
MLGLSATFSAPQAVAVDDYKVYPGGMCVTLPGGTYITHNFGSVENTSPTAYLFIDCPVVKDVYRRIKEGWVQTTDRHPSADVACNLVQMMRRFQDSTIVFRVDGRRTSGANSSVQVLHHNPPDPDGTTGGASHNYYTCEIPPTYNSAVSGIHSYSIIAE